MSSSGTVKRSKILNMLKNCTDGFTIKEGTHNDIIICNGRTYNTFPKGAHGKSDSEIQKGHCRQLVRQLKIDKECAKRFLPLLR